jgi:hypothetical protein
MLAKKILFIILMLTVVSGLYADGFKLMVGLNLLKYSARASEGTYRWSQKLGLCAGGGFEFDLSESQRIAIEIDGFIVQKKGIRTEEGEPTNEELTFSMSTLRIPLLVRFRPKASLPLYVLGGSEFSLVLSHSFERKIGENKQQGDLKELTRGSDLGIVLGCGFEVRMKEFQNLFVELRFHYGSLNMNGDYKEFSSLRTHVLLLVVGIKAF